MHVCTAGLDIKSPAVKRLPQIDSRVELQKHLPLTAAVNSVRRQRAGLENQSGRCSE